MPETGTAFRRSEKATAAEQSRRIAELERRVAALEKALATKAGTK